MNRIMTLYALAFAGTSCLNAAVFDVTAFGAKIGRAHV